MPRQELQQNDDAEDDDDDIDTGITDEKFVMEHTPEGHITVPTELWLEW